MNIPRIQNPIKRRLHLLWIIPYYLAMIVPYACWGFLKHAWIVINEGPASLMEVWRGRR